jgi:hypothetical protein
VLVEFWTQRVAENDKGTTMFREPLVCEGKVIVPDDGRELVLESAFAYEKWDGISLHIKEVQEVAILTG